LIVLAFAGDSTMTIFMSFQWLTGKIKAGSARFASAVSQRTWVVGRSLSNRQMLKGTGKVATQCLKSCKILSIVVLSKRVAFENTRAGCVLEQDRGVPEMARSIRRRCALL
jgi:hypothetical protein